MLPNAACKDSKNFADYKIFGYIYKMTIKRIKKHLFISWITDFGKKVMIP